MSVKKIICFICLVLFVGSLSAQTNRKSKEQWVTVSDDETVTISYNSNITTTKKGEHLVWVKAVYHTREWQMYFANMIGSRQPVVTTRTKAHYDDIYSLVMVRQVMCYNKAGKLVYNSGDDASAGWGYVNASDPVGIVGEYLGDKLRKKTQYE